MANPASAFRCEGPSKDGVIASNVAIIAVLISAALTLGVSRGDVASPDAGTVTEDNLDAQ